MLRFDFFPWMLNLMSMIKSNFFDACYLPVPSLHKHNMFCFDMVIDMCFNQYTLNLAERYIRFPYKSETGVVSINNMEKRSVALWRLKYWEVVNMNLQVAFGNQLSFVVFIMPNHRLVQASSLKRLPDLNHIITTVHCYNCETQAVPGFVCL